MVSSSLSQVLRSLVPVKRGEDVHSVASSERINAIQTAIHLLTRGDNIVGGLNVRKKSGDGFVILSSDAGAGAQGGGGRVGFPWEVSVVDEGEFGFHVHVKPGTINSVLPSNMFDTWEIAEFGTYYVTLDVITDGQSPTDAIIDGNSDVPPDVIGSSPNVAPIDFSIMIAIIQDRIVFQLAKELLQAIPVESLHTLKESPEPGAPYYDIWWSWQISGY